MKLNTPLNKEDQMQGNLSAPLILVEYGDYECSYCGMAYPIIRELQGHFGRNLLFVFRNFPLTEIHAHALNAARIAEASAKQEKFWAVHDLIFENQDALLPKQLLSYVKLAGADIHKVLKDKDAAFVTNKIERDIESGARSGVNGTPTFFINGTRYDGELSFQALRDELEQLLLKM